MSYELVPLGELGEIVAGSTPDTNNNKYWGGDIAWITPADLTNHEGIYFTGELRKITEAGYKSCSTKMLPAGSILFSSRAPIGYCAVTSFPLCTNQGFKSIIPNERLDAIFGFFALKFFTPQIEALGRGATFTEINKEIFENFRIPLPSLTEQKRIASLLKRADRLRQLRQTAHDLGDALLQSVFLEMFGDPLQNPKNWKRIRLENCCHQVVDCMHTTPNWTNSGVLCVRTSNLTNTGGWDWSDTRYVTEEEYKERTVRSEVNVGDIILSREGTVGVVAIVLPEMKICLGQRLVQVSPKRKVMTSEFMLWLLLYELSPERIDKVMTGSTSQHLNLADLRKMEIIVPPLSLQEEFAGVVARVESLRGRMGESERHVDGLFESLLSESFGGTQ